MMANFIVPKAEMFYARSGHEFAKEFMEDVVGGAVSGTGMKCGVGFAVTPGFRIGNSIVPCRVNLCRRKP